MKAITNCDLVESEHLGLHYAPLTNPMFMGAWKTRFSSDNVETQIDEVLLWFKQRNPNTDKVLDTVVVLVNPSGAAITERVMIANAGLMDTTLMFDLLDPTTSIPACTIEAAFMTVTVPPEAVMILVPREQQLGGYSRYKRVS